MALSGNLWTEARIERLFKEGRGEGHGASYRPFIEVTDLSSQGASRRLLGHTTGRVHHLLSNVEYHFFLMLEWNRDVIDIREQYPLARDLTLAVASEIRIDHPCYPGTKVPTVMTIDQMVTKLIDGKEVYEAYDIKRTEEAEKSRSVEKLEITRSACEAMGIPHRLIYHSLLPHTKIQNIEWILGARLSDDKNNILDLTTDHCPRLLQSLAREPKEKTLRECCDKYDIAYGLLPGAALRFARILMYERALSPNLSLPDLPNAPLGEFQVFAQPGSLRAIGE